MNSTDILIRAFGYGTDLSTVTLAEIEDAFVDAGYSKEDAEEEAAFQDGRILPNKIRIHRNR
jgi:hypothetical protein